MASSGKKSKKKNWKHVDLSDVIDSSAHIPRKSSSWADDPELDSYDQNCSRKIDNVVLPTAPRAARAQEDDSKIPQEPPYVAYLTNLPYEVDEEELTNHLQNMKVAVKIKRISLPREDRGNNRFKGYGYVEFEDRASFVNILNEADLTIKGRRMRIDVTSNFGDSGRGGRGMRGGGGGNEPDYINQDWRLSRDNRDDKDRDDGYRRRDYGGDHGGGGGGGGYGRRDDRRGGYGDRGGYKDRAGFRDDNREWSRDGDRDRERGGSWRGEDRGYGRSNYDDKRSDYNSWRRDQPESDKDRDHSERSSEPRSRPKITLQPRTKPLEDQAKESDSSAAIFGGAKPVNTAAREREIEERLAKQLAAADDPAKRKGTSSSSYDSWDRDKDHARHRDRDSRDKDRDDRGRDRDKGWDNDRNRDYDKDIDKNNDSDDRDIDTDKERVSSRENDSKDEDAPRKLEPAPPPKENPWVRRGQQQNSSSVNNRKVSRKSTPLIVESQPKSRGSSPCVTSDDSSSSGEGLFNSSRAYQPPRGQSNEPRRGTDRKQQPHDDRSKSNSGSGRGSSTNAPSSRGGSHGSARSREPKKDDREETLRMPKFQEQKAPNFAGSNKFAFLEESNETAAN